MVGRCPACGMLQQYSDAERNHCTSALCELAAGAELLTMDDRRFLKSLRIDSEQDDIEAVRKLDEQRKPHLESD